MITGRFIECEEVQMGGAFYSKVYPGDLAGYMNLHLR